VRGEWTWPIPVVDEQAQGDPRVVQLMRLAAVRDVVVRLLVSDPRRRPLVGALWDEPWMHDEAMVLRSSSFLFDPSKPNTTQAIPRANVQIISPSCLYNSTTYLLVKQARHPNLA
jgi:hypothetical protein